jgi:menaquinone-dependent protoporphyrinogen oxidase
MSRVLIVHASRHGATAGIAERIGEVMQADDIEAAVEDAAGMPDPAPFDACVVGGGVYMGSWVKDGTVFLDRYATSLARIPVWLFSSGPLPDSTKESTKPIVDPIENALGPATGPGSGGRRQIEDLVARIHPREHRVFAGAYDPDGAPTSLAERVVRMMPRSKGILPSGDFRDWPAIDAWAHEIATAVREPVAV